ncbi:hypothetical protein [Noviherbaspirillum humi]|uniref:hypothetical protein n=1 Tax=Noviherbaspirillum humi TaxID=1688639 RepID=UPI0011606D97|nr:hypothetical protein [Noviherbaspirillum humi]
MLQETSGLRVTECRAREKCHAGTRKIAALFFLIGGLSRKGRTLFEWVVDESASSLVGSVAKAQRPD